MPFRQRIRTWLSGLHGNTIGALWILLAAFLFTVSGTLVKILGQDISIFQILLIRQITMAAIVAPKIIRGLPGSLRTRRPDLQAARIILATIAMLTGFTALIHLPLADSTALGFSKTFFITIFAILFLGETVGIHRWLATIAGFIGVIIMLKPGGENLVDPYALLAIISASTAGLIMIIIRILTRTDQPTTILTYQAIFVGLIVLGPAVYAWTPPTLEQWGLLILIGAISWGGQMSNIQAFKVGEATAISVLDYTRLLHATIIGVFVFGNWPSAETLIGALIILGASFYTIRREAIRGKALARSQEARRPPEGMT